MVSELQEIHAWAWRQLGRQVEKIVYHVYAEQEARETLAAVGADPSFENVAEDFDELRSQLEHLESAIAERDRSQVANLAESVEQLTDDLGVPTPAAMWAYIQEYVEQLQISEPVVLFAPAAPRIHIPQLIVSAQTSLFDMIKRDPDAVFGVGSREFEEMVAEIFAKRGYVVQLTQATRDGGRDIIAVREEMDIRNKYLIECKRYAPHRKVSIGVVQRLFGVKISEGATKAILATTSGFSAPAQAFASQHVWDLELKGYDTIMKWIREYHDA
jgi:hypothetical protein